MPVVSAVTCPLFASRGCGSLSCDLSKPYGSIVSHCWDDRSGRMLIGFSAGFIVGVSPADAGGTAWKEDLCIQAKNADGSLACVSFCVQRGRVATCGGAQVHVSRTDVTGAAADASGRRKQGRRAGAEQGDDDTEYGEWYYVVADGINPRSEPVPVYSS